MKYMKHMFFFLTIIFSSVLISVPSAHAVTPTSFVAGVSVLPYESVLSVNPGKATLEEYNLQNTSNAAVSVRIKFVNFKAPLDESGNPAYFSNAADPQQYPQTWFSGPSQVDIPKGGSIEVPITIAVPKDASPGGHYGGIEFNPLSELALQGGNTINIGAEVAVPVLLSVAGNIQENISISAIHMNPGFVGYVSDFLGNNWCSGTCSFNLNVELKNSGNIQEIPNGFVEYYNMFGNKVASVSFNKTDGYILANSKRIYFVPFSINSLGNFAIGNYTAKVSFIYGSKEVTVVGQNDFWVVNWSYGIVVLLIIVIAAVIYGAKKHNKKNMVMPE